MKLKKYSKLNLLNFMNKNKFYKNRNHKTIYTEYLTVFSYLILIYFKKYLFY